MGSSNKTLERDAAKSAAVVVLYSWEFPKWRAKKLLEAFLADGPLPSNAMWEEISKAGVPERTYFKARKEVGVRAFRIGGRGGCWWVAIPRNGEAFRKYKKLPASKAIAGLTPSGEQDRTLIVKPALYP